jgi:hypothetical protein
LLIYVDLEWLQDECFWGLRARSEGRDEPIVTTLGKRLLFEERAEAREHLDDLVAMGEGDVTFVKGTGWC